MIYTHVVRGLKTRARGRSAVPFHLRHHPTGLFPSGSLIGESVMPT